MRHHLSAVLILVAAAVVSSWAQAQPRLVAPPDRPGPSAPVAGRGDRVLCESDNGNYRECHIPGRARIQLLRQLSDASCTEGRSWGVRGNRIWVNRGCRAEFLAFGGAWGSGWGGSIVCASDDQRTVTCAWDARLGRPRLLEQLSSAACREGQSWGQTRSGDIWVGRGCRGRFGGRKAPRR